MATVIPFEERAVAHLRERLGAVEEANEDLIAFARGHSGAVASIHSAVLAAIEADGVDGLLPAAPPEHSGAGASNPSAVFGAIEAGGVECLLHVVTQEWPLILGIDSVALSLI